MSERIIALKNNKILNNLTGETITSPAMFCDKETGTVHAWGEVQDVQATYDKFTARCIECGLKDAAQDYVMMDLSGLTHREQEYALKMSVEISASPFPKMLYRHFMDGTVKEWLAIAMKGE
ncbi:MAG: hypothetical protein HDQ88_02320 [Clostridia bacterium]|nr:hypothetical protein [Clostridia bacterium]